jgi:peptide chain release factor 3
VTPAAIGAEAARRRTFAIISHPDAGKTTLTEKLLLYGGAIRLAGSVRRRRTERHATSDWMAIERERGISVSTSVLQFDFRGLRLNLLDTPGHDDFSEDTYRTLAAADCAVMLIDAAKGVEPQTVKLFEVCRLRRLPIVTFINKMDRHGRDPLALLDEVEKVLGIPTTPAAWPIGAGEHFRGIFDRWSEEVLLFDRSEGGARPVPVTVASLSDRVAAGAVPEALRQALFHDLELVEVAGVPFERERFLAGDLTPVFFGSALTNFGVERFLERFVDLCPAARPREAEDGVVPVDSPSFSGFVFKIQANMDPLHRDRIAFVRICAGRFARGMELRHARTGRTIAAHRAMRLRSRERTTIEEAYPGDIVGIWDPGLLRIGDTLFESVPVRYPGIPRFSPEHFARVRLRDPLRRKQLKRGLEELSEEGAAQLFFDRSRLGRDPVLGAVGLLQFDVVRHRLQSEYGVEADLERLPFRMARWVVDGGDRLEDLERLTSAVCLLDVEGRPLLLFKSDFELRWLEERHPALHLASAVQPARSGGSGAFGEVG